jgi:uncharacterized OsmC-like protein
MQSAIVYARYLGEQRAEVQAETRNFVVDQRVKVGEGRQFCPVELITASLAS